MRSTFAPKVILVIGFTLICTVVFSQPPGPRPPDPDVPITGIELLLGGGALLGVKSVIARLKSKKHQ